MRPFMPDHSKTTPPDDADDAGSSGEQAEARPGTIWRRPAPRTEVDVTLELTLSKSAGETTSRDLRPPAKWPPGASPSEKK
ncbi:hypothetical protein AMYX_37710 [Anaeromyxobacter diazotrophicus]|uniref:Uncharacterized protein n=1 Tax=Anaeromyxobacter diazotrophicus TaxID=2590199 RepID=A0A7I9VSD8_9BACT|nr:hypothetical protein AMYX_37710 [Anaeromyxobacter diazotrophicus]